MRLNEADAEALGRAIRQHRESIGMSRPALGRLISRDPATLQSWEQGGKKVYGTWIVSTPTDMMFEKLAAALGTTADGLLVAAGLSEESEVAGAAAVADAAAEVRAVNAAISGVTITGKAEDVSALLGLALERGLLGRLKFSPVHAG